MRKNAFILKMQELDYQFKFHLYGNMEDYDAVAKDKNIIWRVPASVGAGRAGWRTAERRLRPRRGPAPIHCAAG